MQGFVVLYTVNRGKTLHGGVLASLTGELPTDKRDRLTVVWLTR